MHSNDSWAGGPLFETQIRLCNDFVSALSQERQVAMLRALSISDVYGSPDDLDASKESIGCWASTQVTYGRWSIGDIAVGVKIFPGLGRATDLLLAVPPQQLQRHAVNYPWSASDEWATPEVVKLFKSVVACIRRCNTVVPIKAAIIQDEAWTGSLDDDSSGILVPEDIAVQCDFESDGSGWWRRIDIGAVEC